MTIGEQIAILLCMDLKTYIRNSERGAIALLAKRISGHQSDVSDWVKGVRPVPAARCVAIEKATAGQVTRQELRPDDWHQIWPELKRGAK